MQRLGSQRRLRKICWKVVAYSLHIFVRMNKMLPFTANFKITRWYGNSLLINCQLKTFTYADKLYICGFDWWYLFFVEFTFFVLWFHSQNNNHRSTSVLNEATSSVSCLREFNSYLLCYLNCIIGLRWNGIIILQSVFAVTTHEDLFANYLMR